MLFIRFSFIWTRFPCNLRICRLYNGLVDIESLSHSSVIEVNSEFDSLFKIEVCNLQQWELGNSVLEVKWSTNFNSASKLCLLMEAPFLHFFHITLELSRLSCVTIENFHADQSFFLKSVGVVRATNTGTYNFAISKFSP